MSKTKLIVHRTMRMFTAYRTEKGPKVDDQKGGEGGGRRICMVVYSGIGRRADKGV